MPKMPRAKESLSLTKINLNYSPKNSADLTLGPMIIFPFLCQKPSGSGRFLLPFALSLSFSIFLDLPLAIVESPQGKNWFYANSQPTAVKQV